MGPDGYSNVQKQSFGGLFLLVSDSGCSDVA